MAKKDVQLSEDEMLEDHSAEVLEALESQMDQALNAIGMQAENYAKGLCPVVTGRLRNSITHTISGLGSMTRIYETDPDQDGGTTAYEQTIGTTKYTHHTAYIGTNVEYAPYVEFGVPSKNRDPKPFLKPAVQNHKSEYIAIAESYLKNS